ncbi:MAG: nucleotidyl transferase AbiEii/AbiGii toxin family protein [Burkholderiales bacterium]
MSKRTFARPRHAAVTQILGALNAPFLHHAQCYFGGGTRIVLALDEYRESADIDFLCSSRDGYRDLRATIDNNSLGKIASGKIRLAREIAADRYGIRTFIHIGEEKIKFEIVHEGRIDVTGSMEGSLGVPCLDENSCCAEKFLANDDRWNDESVLSRDVIDLAFMVEGWGTAPFLAGFALAHAAYGDSVGAAARSAAKKLLDNKNYFKKCVEGLHLTHARTLIAGLRKIAAKRWAAA